MWELSKPDAEDDSFQLAVKYPEAFAALYPENEYTMDLWARSLAGNGRLEEARLSLEKTLANGIKTDEAVLYDYAVVLVRLNADSADVQKAIANWRRNYPHSQAPDPNRGNFLMAPKKRP